MSRRLAVTLAAVAAVAAFPWIAPFSVLGSANLAAAYALVAVSLVLLTGWVGQISLGHAALVGVGAYATGWATGGFGIPFPLSLPIAAAAAGGAAALLGVVALRIRGLYLAVATLVFSWMASEFLFRQPWFTKHDQIAARTIGGQGWLPSFDFTERRNFYIVAWAITGAVVYLALNVRDSKTGRAFFAVRGSEVAAASLGIDVMRYKLLAFAVSGAIAGAAGNLIMADARVATPDQFTFTVSLFFLAMAVVGGLSSLGGAVASALLFAGLTELFFRVRFLGGFLELVSSGLLALTLLAYRGGLAILPERVQAATARFRGRVEGVSGRARRKAAAAAGPARRAAAAPRRPSRVASRLRALSSAARRSPASALGKRVRPARSVKMGTAEPPIDFRAMLAAAADAAAGPIADRARARAREGNAHLDPPAHGDNGHEAQHEGLELARLRIGAAGVPVGPREQRRPLIEAEGITVRFGGLTAVNDASLSVREGEIVGLIGPNGAGKTTLFNAIAGFNSPSSGTIRLYGRDVTALPVHRRAAVGVARTFQLIQLFGQLSVYQNLLVATHVHNPSGFFSHLTVSDGSLRTERAARERVNQVLDLLDLRGIAHRRTSDLAFGVLRMVEVARALVTGFRVIMLDEPASGLDNTETDRLIDVLRFVRGLGVSLLLIEHDVRMVTGVSDHLYVLDQGRIIAEGPPEEIQRNSAVIAAYLGEPAKEAVG